MFLHYRPIQIGGKEKSNANTMHRKTGREILNLLECLTRRRVQHEIIGAIKPEERVNENKTGDTERESVRGKRAHKDNDALGETSGDTRAGTKVTGIKIINQNCGCRTCCCCCSYCSPWFTCLYSSFSSRRSR